MTRNDVTGDRLITKANSNAYRDNWDAIFGKKETQETEQEIVQDNKEE